MLIVLLYHRSDRLKSKPTLSCVTLLKSVEFPLLCNQPIRGNVEAYVRIAGKHNHRNILIIDPVKPPLGPAIPARQSHAMPPLTSTTSNLLRTCARHQSPAMRAPATAIQRRGKADVIQRATAGEYRPTSSFDSPFRGGEESPPTTKIPNFKNYMAKGGETSNKVFSYFMVGTLGALAAAGAKAIVQGGQFQISCKVMIERGTWRRIWSGWANVCVSRFPSQHVRLRRHPGSS